MKKRLATLAFACVLTVGSSLPVFAAANETAPACLPVSTSENDTVEDNAPVIGEYTGNAELEALAAQKERAAEQYYALKLTRSNMAESYLEKYTGKKLVTPKLKSGSASVYATDKRLAIYQRPQDTGYWCGYAAIQSLLEYENVHKTQKEIANDVYSEDKSCPWYLSNGQSLDQFPVPNYLHDLIGFYYFPYPLANAGTVSFTGSDIKSKIVSTIDLGHGTLACGTSKSGQSGHASIFPGYPARSITHWVAIDGYKDSGKTIWIVDPAKSPEVSWSDSISAYYSVSVDKLAAFAQTRGILY